MDSLRRQLKDLQIRPKKRLGQHFVIAPRVLHQIVETAELQPDDLVVEIGAGTGSLTDLLAQKAQKVYALEIDSVLIPVLQSRFSGCRNVEIVAIDALDFDFADLARQWGKKIKAVANLPYEISTPILFRFFENRESFSLLVLMLQKEVARRLVASPGTKDYGPLSLWTRLYTDAHLTFSVPPGAFHPAPKVESAVVRFEILPKPRIPVGDRGTLRKVIQSAFTYRRKMLANALRLGDFSLLSPEKIQEALVQSGIDPAIRGERLSLEEFERVASAFHSLL